MKKTAARGHTAKHSASSKHGPASKHSPKRKVKSPSAHHASVHTVAKPASHAKPVGLAVAPGDVACCAAQAVAESLRIALSVRVSDSDVLALHWLAGGSADAGVPILAALEAAPVALGHSVRFELTWAARECPRTGTIDYGGMLAPPPTRENPFWPLRVRTAQEPRPTILRLQLPAGPHAVLDDGDHWWSWGEPYDPATWPDAVVEEAWAITWQ